MPPVAVGKCSGVTAARAPTSAWSQGAQWHLNSGAGGAPERSFVYGRPDDVPVVGDWDGDGNDNPGMFKNADGSSATSPLPSSADHSFTSGTAGDRPHTWMG